ncbi:MAG: host attachment protein [Nitrospirae bacterium]|nr:host attachment protein [Nitrospirota bacterium]
MKKIIVTVDLGHFKAYNVTKEDMESPRITLIESYDSVEGHGKISEKFSDKTGRFGSVGSKNGTTTGSGEPHNTQLENSKRQLKLIAKDINSIITRGNCDGWYLAAGKKINNQIVENLDPSVRAKLEKNILSDLTKADKAALLDRFQ